MKSKEKLFGCVTTIQYPTYDMKVLNDKLQIFGGTLVVAGDVKGPEEYTLSGCKFLHISDQQNAVNGHFESLLPKSHYARKNVAYLYAIENGATCIYETDDDNCPNDTWKPREIFVKKSRAPVFKYSAWVNVYDYFTSKSKHIWPRGFPLDEVNRAPQYSICRILNDVYSPIQQSLVDGSPDVDAIYRLTKDCFEEELIFEKDTSSLTLGEDQWSPFNTQSTWWFKEAFPLLYIPSYCSFRMCDIWKSFIAQKCLWAMGHRVTFHTPEVFQKRNEHNLMDDFKDEICGYLRNKEMIEILNKMHLTGCPKVDIIVCYDVLTKAGFFDEKETKLVRAWVAALESIEINQGSL